MRRPIVGRRQILAVAGISMVGALAACNGEGTDTQHLNLGEGVDAARSRSSPRVLP